MRFGALSDIRVIDLTQMLAGPYSTLKLVDHGATVIKVESLEGDMTRANTSPDARELPGYFQSIGRNKESVVLDLKSAGGRAASWRWSRPRTLWSRTFVPG